ncbi:MAG: hypothetical protein IPG06_20885 [Haliea sp.]|nr:hypothetical protein [Haliea sp.]
MFKFEFFYAPTEEFHRQIREELDRYDKDWPTVLSRGTVGFTQLFNRMIPLVSHVTLLIYAEAYSVVTALAARMEHAETLEEEACVSNALKFGRQAYLQRRISSEASIGKCCSATDINAAEPTAHRRTRAESLRAAAGTGAPAARPAAAAGADPRYWFGQSRQLGCTRRYTSVRAAADGSFTGETP